MARIQPISESERTQEILKAFEKHTEEYNAKITNMKATLAHSVLAFDVYMQWYPLYAEVERILCKRLAYLYAYSISSASECPLCSTFFRKMIIDAGEKPAALELTPSEQKILDFGSSIAKHHGNIADHVYDAVASHFNTAEMTMFIAFAGQMIATNVFSNVIETDIDEYLFDYLPPLRSAVR